MKPKPDLTGTMGLAWKLDGAALTKGRPHAGVATWLVSAPWAHPAWPHYLIDGIHLREVAGFPPAVLFLPGATHQIIVAAIDPGWEFAEGVRPVTLRPLNFAAQFQAEDDAAAAARLEKTVGEIITGQLNPDTDALSQWVQRYGGNMLKGSQPRGGIVQVGSTAIVLGTGAENMRTLGGREGRN